MSKQPSYVVFLSTRNRHRDLKATVTSMLWQNLPPKLVLIFDNGSNPRLDKSFFPSSWPTHFLYGDDGVYDTRNVVKYWNQCLAYLHQVNGAVSFEFTLISADDCIYPFDYAETILSKMTQDNVAVASGNRGISRPIDGWRAPEGAGRFVSTNFWKQTSWHIPETIGYEPWIVYEAMRRGMNTKAYDMAYWHFRPLGGVHGFIEWGHTAHMLGYYPPLFMIRVARNLVLHSIPFSGSLRMLKIYLADFIRTPSGPFYQPFDKDLRQFVRDFQKSRLKSALMAALGRNAKKATKSNY